MAGQRSQTMQQNKTYITRKRARFKALCGDVNIPYGTPVNEAGGALYWQGKLLCMASSQNAYDYFVPDTDGQGLERGQLINEILSSLSQRDAQHQARWDKIWQNRCCQLYRRNNLADYWL